MSVSNRVDCANSSVDLSFPVPPHLLRILARLQQAGHRVVIVGGAVRDYLRGRQVSDYDLASDALPQQVQKLFRRCLPTGLQHGTVTIMQGQNAYEITSFRSDGIYKDGRRPETVEFTGDLAGDLARRDFTINALAFEPAPIGPRTLAANPRNNGQHQEAGRQEQELLVPLPGRLHDPHGGVAHLKNGFICAIGTPVLRFEEDALRMLRACRFSAKLGFAIEEQTLAAIRQLHATLDKVSRPRVQDELRQLLTAPFALRGLGYLRESGLWPELFPFLPLLGPSPLLDYVWSQWQELRSCEEMTAGPELSDKWPILLLHKAHKFGDSSGKDTSGPQELADSPYLRWHGEQVPSLSFAWALLHLVQADILQFFPNPASLVSLIGSTDTQEKNGRLEALLQNAEQGLNDLLFTNREKAAALTILRHSVLVWGPALLQLCAGSAQQQRAVLLRRFLCIVGPDFALPALCLLGSTAQFVSVFRGLPDHASNEQEGTAPEKMPDKTLWCQFCDDLLQVLTEKPALSIKELAIEGKILRRDCGVAPGPQMGLLLQQLMRHVLQYPEDNQPETLKDVARDIYQNMK